MNKLDEYGQNFNESVHEHDFEFQSLGFATTKVLDRLVVNLAKARARNHRPNKFVRDSAFSTQTMQSLHTEACNPTHESSGRLVGLQPSDHDAFIEEHACTSASNASHIDTGPANNSEEIEYV